MRSPVRTTASTSSCPLLRPGVPTQMSDMSDAATASSLDVVARRRPAPTTSASSSASPGSTTGGVAALTIATFSALMSTPTTSWPAFARQAAVTDPTYPRPNRATRMTSAPLGCRRRQLLASGHHRYRLASRLELARHRGPGIPGVDEVPTRPAQRLAPVGVAQEGHDRASELGRTVGADEVNAVDERKALGTHRGGHHGLAHREALEDLESRAATHPQRHQVDGGIGDPGADVLHRPGDPDARRLTHRPQPRRRITTDDGQLDAGDGTPDHGEDLADEEHHRVFVRVPVHRADEDEARRRLRHAVGREVGGV